LTAVGFDRAPKSFPKKESDLLVICCAIRLYATELNKTFAIPAAGVSWKAASVFNVRYGNLDSDVVRPLWS
jgi:hypothetical protein